MSASPARCLILACGNTLRSDDGVGPWLAVWAEERFREQPEIRVICRQQWTPDLADDVAHAESVLFIDCSAQPAPGCVKLIPVEPAAATQGLATHHLSAAELLALSRDLYNFLPRTALLLTVGASSTQLGESFSAPVTAALPRACGVLEKTVLRFIQN